MQQWVISCFLTCLNCIIHYSESVGPIKVVWNTQQILSSLKSCILIVLHVWHLAANVKMHKNVYCLSISITSVQTHATHAAMDRRRSGRHLRFNMSRNKEREWDSVPKDWEWREVTATLKGVLDKMYSNCSWETAPTRGEPESAMPSQTRLLAAVPAATLRLRNTFSQNFYLNDWSCSGSTIHVLICFICRWWPEAHLLTGLWKTA